MVACLGKNDLQAQKLPYPAKTNWNARYDVDYNQEKIIHTPLPNTLGGVFSECAQPAYNSKVTQQNRSGTQT